MNGLTASRALLDRFSAIHRSEIGRLDKKLRGLTDDDRRIVEALTADIILAIAHGPSQRLAGDSSPLAVTAVVKLFKLDPGQPPAR
jgi:glutamyl-tRNA reductase